MLPNDRCQVLTEEEAFFLLMMLYRMKPNTEVTKHNRETMASSMFFTGPVPSRKLQVCAAAKKLINQAFLLSTAVASRSVEVSMYRRMPSALSKRTPYTGS